MLVAGGWDAVVAVIQDVPAALGVVAIAALLWFLAPELKKRVRDDDFEVEMPGGAKVKFSEANKNIVNTVTDLQNQVKQLVGDREERLKRLPITFENSELIEPKAEPEEPAQPAPGLQPEPESEVAPESGKGAGPGGPAPNVAGKGAGPGGPGPTPSFPGVLMWIDPNLGEHTIERSQLQKGGWVVEPVTSINLAMQALSNTATMLPRAIVITGSALLVARTSVNVLRNATPAPIFVYDPGGGTETIETTRAADDTFITSSAVELLSALTETRCGQCGLLLPEPGNLRTDRRTPCPNCGSLSRAYARGLSASLTSGSTLSGRLSVSEAEGKQ